MLSGCARAAASYRTYLSPMIGQPERCLRFVSLLALSSTVTVTVSLHMLCICASPCFGVLRILLPAQLVACQLFIIIWPDHFTCMFMTFPVSHQIIKYYPTALDSARGACVVPLLGHPAEIIPSRPDHDNACVGKRVGVCGLASAAGRIEQF